MEESQKEVSFTKKKIKKRNFDLKLPDYIRIDWRRPKCYCKEACHCSNFNCRMTYTSPDAPLDRAIDTKEEEGIDWTKLLNIDLLNVTWRRARISDFNCIHKLVDENSKALFEIDDVGSKILYLIEHSFYFLVAVNFQGVIVGAISVNDTPPLCYIAPAEWDSWLQGKFGLYTFRYHNTLWIHFLAYAKRYKHVIFYNLLVPIFLRCNLVTKLAIYVPPKVKVRKKWVCYFERVGTTVKPGPEESRLGVDSDSDEYPTNIYCVSRNRFLEPLTLKKAEKEDEDAMYKTLEKDHKKLSKKFGANYLNKIITDKRYNTFIGSTVDSQAQPAVFVLQTDFDVEYIRDKFEIYAFNSFKKNKATDYLMQPEKRYISAVSQEMVEVSDVMNGEEVRRPHEQDDKDDVEEKEEKDDEEGEPTVIEGLTWTNFLMTGTQDSDEEEGRGMDRIICTDNPIDKITYKNLCMSMSSSNVVKDFKAVMAARKTQGTVNLSFEVDGNFNVLTLEYINMGAEPITSVKTFFLKILDSFPTYEYIILKIPRKVTPPDCITHMMRVFPLGHKNWLYFDEDLYLFHRWFASGIAECRKAEKADFQTLLNVLCMENSSEEIQQELFSSLFGQDQRSTAVAFSVNKKIVGAAIISPEREMEFYKFHYNLEKLMVPTLHNQSEIGYVKHMVINGLHEFSTRDFVRGFMQFMGWKSVFFTRYPSYIHEQITDFSLPSGLRHFVPVRPRRVPAYAPSLLGKVPPYHLRNDYPPFALYYLNYRISASQKRINHTKIVVVGTGETGLSFLENFFFRSASETELFTEVVVITKHHAPFAYPRRIRINRRKKSGMASVPKSEDLYFSWLNIMRERLEKSKGPYEKSVNQKLETILRMYSGGLSDQKSREDGMYETTFKSIAERMLPRTGRYTSKYVCKLGLETWTNVVEGTMTAIHREEKCVEVEGKKMIPYDYLFLFCGKQFSTPQADHRNIVLGKECKSLYDLKTPWIRRVSLKPRNLFMINCLSDATIALQYIKRLNPGRGQILVYGSCVNCLSCIEALLQFGVIPSRIAFVESDLNAPYAVDYFNDPVVYKAIRRKMFEIGISHYFYYNFVNWDYNEASQLISKAHFESESRMASLKCLALFSFSPKEIGLETLLSYTESNLVYDGGLVIDTDFRTNDPYIYAAGPGTRYKKKYFADHYFHEHYNSSEVGDEMAERAFVIIPNLPHHELETKQDIIDFKKPVVTACCIPGNKYLLMVRRPGPIVPLEVLINQLDFGSILVTGNANTNDSSEPEYFKIILNNQNFVIDIICLSSIPIDVDNIVQLYGRHEKMLNNLLLRYKSHVITDFYEFFKEPWAYLFYHDRFDHLMEKMRGQFYVKLPLSDKTFADLIAEALKRSNWTQLPQSAMPLLDEIFLSFPDLKKKMAAEILAFFNKNRNHLPMALNDEFTRSVLQIAGENIIYIQNAHRAGGKPLVSKPYSFEKHKKMYQPKEYYERIE